MSTGIVLFTRDLRVTDNPTLWHAVHEHERVVPLFVLDEAVLGSAFNRPNRAAFLAESLSDLDASLRERGAGLVVRRGAVATVVAELAAGVSAEAVHVSGDASGYAERRRRRLGDALAGIGSRLVVHDDTLFVVPPGELVPSGGGDHMAVFSAYHRRWERAGRRRVLQAPRSVAMPRIARGTVPSPGALATGETSPARPPGGETAARRRLRDWLAGPAGEYGEGHDDLAGDRTSRLSPYLHLGCLSPVDLVSCSGVTGELVRQVAWRDFHAQVLAARPNATRRDYRPRGDHWRDAPDELRAWKEGRTGLPLVDAGMRQLRKEGWMHNRARLVVGHFLTKTLYIDWRLGAQHFADWLVDGDVANNTMNWQWVAGTGTDSRFNRTANVTAQARRYDPSGDYVRRYVPELRGIGGGAVHEPWLLSGEVRGGLGYPEPIVDVAEGNRRFLRARGKA